LAVVQYQGAASVLLNNSGTPLTKTALASSVNPVAINQTVTYTATVTPQSGGTTNGTVVFMDGVYIEGEIPLTGNRAQLKQSYASVGTHSITAYYTGDLNKDAGSISKALTENVRINSTITALTSNLNPSIYGQSVTFTAIVTGRQSTPPTGKVTFAWSGYTIGSATLNRSGVATLTKSNLNAVPADRGIQGRLPQPGQYLPDLESGGDRSHKLRHAHFVARPVDPRSSGDVHGQDRVADGHANRATTFTAGKTVLGTVQLSGGKAKFTTSTVDVGSTKVTVSYDGDSNIAKCSASVTQIVQQ
jgi:hypothetical protein